ncbi:hypothetical protein [Bacillus sp. S/N-304-OC-R1]|uniref:hypothetical protein n=1 Tax=Bacillus sp. S/N-304-OC-R1 TaxID=2758034 RepID=UPI001C8E3618|nr:hypothetical protein [Bacillus sp. S/N-304-OC-R1]MBY0123031.1 hypothetical protein [Bacillus sp. S/N-304-OC-R1]
MSKLKNRYDIQWEQLKHIQPSQKEKDALRARLLHTLKNESMENKPKKRYQWTGLLASCLFLLICGGGIWKVVSDGILQNQTIPRNANEQGAPINDEFSWKLKNARIEKSAIGWNIISDKTSSKVGEISVITQEEMEDITSSLPMFVDEKLEGFPYPMTMYIEHVKMMDTAIRYHFFVPIQDEKIAHFSFDYPKVEHAEIFQAMATLNIAGLTPSEKNEQLYVKHGYGSMLFPVGLDPISISSNEERYRWEYASTANYQMYLDKISSGYWKKESSKGTRTTLVSADGRQIVTITLEDSDLLYEFTYIDDEE